MGHVRVGAGDKRSRSGYGRQCKWVVAYWTVNLYEMTGIRSYLEICLPGVEQAVVSRSVRFEYFGLDRPSKWHRIPFTDNYADISLGIARRNGTCFYPNPWFCSEGSYSSGQDLKWRLYIKSDQ